MRWWWWVLAVFTTIAFVAFTVVAVRHSLRYGFRWEPFSFPALLGLMAAWCWIRVTSR